ncbi:hypothetical protein SBRCBS47491_000171 [Sporothrix bragantina]|uniref:IBR domain-containing protein n=1 Tax=Sporothrix bragantina TaxID=671064 RepID=A0ABP0AN49_9PEZI
MASAAYETTAGSTAQRQSTRDMPRCCYVCLEPCVPGTDSLVSREDAHAIICRFTVNGVRVSPGEPCTSIVRGTHYARPSAFDCHECDACVCYLCLYRHLLDGIKHVGNHAIKCACGKVPLINEKTLLLLTPEQERQLYLRCDEWRCPDPLYCPIPTCSAYIPMLQCLMPGASGDEKGERRGPRVNCVQCRTPICTQCKGIANDLAHSNPDEQCMRPNVHGTQELKMLMWKSGFKQW